MRDSRVFKSDDGRDKILSYYKKMLKKVDFDYTERFVTTSFGNTYLLTSGDPKKPTLMLFHGSCSNSIMWFGDLKTLSRDFHVLSVDIIGDAGNSDEKRLNTKSDDYAIWINEIVESLGISKVNLIGNSLGAWMSLKFATCFPEKTDKMVLIAPSGFVNVNLLFVLKSIFYVIQGKKGNGKMNKLIFGTDDIPKEIIEFQKLIIDGFNPMVGGLPVFSDDELKKLTNPILFICGENDATLNAKKAGNRLSKLCPKAEVDILEGWHHAVFGQTEKIAKFLKK